MPPPDDREAVMNSIAADLGVRRRGDWGAQAPAHELERDWNYNAIVIHNSGHGHLDTMLKIQNFDLTTRHWDDISYHYGILPDGTIFEGRQLVYKGADVYRQNTGKIGVVCIGDYDASVINWFNGRAYSGDPVVPAMLDSVRRLSRRLVAAFPGMTYFGGHMEYGDTNDCPGSVMMPYMAQLRTELKLAVPVKRSLR